MRFIVAVSLLVEETKWVIRRRKSKKDRKYNDQKIDDKRTDNTMTKR
jgi:hypothetical protein